MFKKIKEFIFVQPLSLEDMTKAYALAVEQQDKETSEAQHTVNRALAMYCEICDKGFAHTGLAKNHKRLAHKNL